MRFLTRFNPALLWKIYGKLIKEIILTLLTFHGIQLWNQFAHYMKLYQRIYTAYKKDGLRKIAKGCFDIIFLDCNLPDGTGFSFCVIICLQIFLPLYFHLPGGYPASQKQKHGNQKPYSEMSCGMFLQLLRYRIWKIRIISFLKWGWINIFVCYTFCSNIYLNITGSSIDITSLIFFPDHVV